jgi:glycosyltransferase involved in cell wall biosynthesis
MSNPTSSAAHEACPRASVVVTIYRDLRFLDAAVDSVLRQDFADLELIIVDDGNRNDALFQSIARRDPRIRIVHNPINLGTAAAANRGIEIARGDIIVRLDADDIAEPTRVRRLVQALDEDPALGLVGSAVALIDEEGRSHGLQRMPETDVEVRWTILFHNPLYHSAAAYRRSLFEAAGRYIVTELVSQDHYLWFNLLPLCRARNLTEPLARYRLNSHGLTAAHANKNPRGRTHAIREASWKRIGLSYDLYDDAFAADLSGFLRGRDIAPERRGAAYRTLLGVLRAFLRAPRPLRRAADAPAERQLARTLFSRMLADPPLSGRETLGLCRQVWPIDPVFATRAAAVVAAGKIATRWRRRRSEWRAAALARRLKAASGMEQRFGLWLAGKTFSTNWTTPNFPVWATLFASRRDHPLRILEIGSWEGLSAIFFLQYFPQSQLTCIDTFRGSAEHALRPKWAEALPHIEARFDSNVAEFGARVEKIKDTSTHALARLLTERRRYDLVYIDGSHHSADVQSDAVLSWPLVADGGIVIFDDYEWNWWPNDVRGPKLGVDSFLALRRDQYRELLRSQQVIIEKLPSAAPMS